MSFFSSHLSWFFESVFLTGLEFIKKARLAGSPRNLPVSIIQALDIPISVFILLYLFFSMGNGDSSHVLRLERQALY